jgi:hypothetical protein
MRLVILFSLLAVAVAHAENGATLPGDK